MINRCIVILFLITGYVHSQTYDTTSVQEMKHLSGLFKTEKVTYPGDSSINVKYYKLNISVNYDAKSVSGDVLMNFVVSSSAAINSLFLDLESNMVVDSITSEEQLLTYTHQNDVIKVNLGNNYSSGSTIELKVFYHGYPGSHDGNTFGGFVFDRTPDGNPIVWSLSQPYESKNWWPCKDALNDKADSADIWITSSPYFTSVSNGKLIGIADNPDGTRTFKWKESYPIVNYLISLAMADYVLQTDYFNYSPADSMPVTHYIWRERYNNITREQLSRTIPALEVLSDLFGPYPFLKEKYGHAQCSFGGGMEHQTIASMGNFNESLIVHELAHQWFGDKITAGTWQDIWLHEGFATYSVALYNERIYGKSDYQSTIANDMLYAAAALGSIYVMDITRLSEIFDHNRTYSKGAVVLHMLRGVVGDSSFFNILKNYAQHSRFAYGNAATADFQMIAEQVSGMDLDYFFSQWIYGQNFPKYTVSWGYKHLQDSTYTVNVNIEQRKNINPGYFTMPVQVRVQTEKGDTLVTLFNNQQSQSFSFNVTGIPEYLDFDPNKWILKTHTVLTDSGSEPVIRSFRLSQNYPNPFNPSTKIDFTIPRDGKSRDFTVHLKIYDVLGREAAVLINTNLAPGDHTFIFQPGDYGLPSGVYFYNLNVRDSEKALLFDDTGKMIYLR